MPVRTWCGTGCITDTRISNNDENTDLKKPNQNSGVISKQDSSWVFAAKKRHT